MTAAQIEARLAELVGLLIEAEAHRDWHGVRGAVQKAEDLRLAVRKEG